MFFKRFSLCYSYIHYILLSLLIYFCFVQDTPRRNKGKAPRIAKAIIDNLKGPSKCYLTEVPSICFQNASTMSVPIKSMSFMPLWFVTPVLIGPVCLMSDNMHELKVETEVTVQQV